MRNAYRALVGGAALLGVIGVGVGSYAATAPEQEATGVVVDDEAQVLDVEQVDDAVADLSFYAPTQVAVLTHPGDPGDTNDQALNDAVLAHARESRPEWLSEDGQTWADGLYIVAVDPEGRLVGTYFGDDRAVGEDAQADIQEATKDDFRAGRWTEGVIVGIEEGAERIDAPLARNGAGLALGIAGSAGILAAGGTWLGVGLSRSSSSRRLKEDADRRLADVREDAAATERHAKRIPEESRYGFEVLRRFDDYRRGVRELELLAEEAAQVPAAAYNQKSTVSRLTAYQEKAVELDHLDDAIADTAIFLNQDPDWRQAWGRQVEPLRGDLTRVAPLLSEELPEEARELPEGAALRDFALLALGRLDEVQTGLVRGEVSPDDALDVVREVRDELTRHLEGLSDEVVQVVGKDDSQRKTLRSALAEQRSGARPDPSIIGTAYPGWTFFPVAAMSTGVSDGTQQIASASGGGATSGYSAGGFSGAGSSSSF
ncbi:hypothetical protein SGUI_0934 [Serinicoccus hydrothermalis]|uniref:DUF5129 domain-containing protein n=1 Tax=Serinicoccus hydrothermalis TaxID=1758689 RepID=A0A1B1NA56_9MICO|nr:DUF5129 domain-containing protein [Serinicoccus hydrothermalis]ANS78330.1 hypothetical protein SGUI_0934 [Serinicoccus hydrothermalis]